MALYPGDKKALGILGAVVLLAVVIIAGATTALTWGRDTGHEPTFSVEAGGHWERIAPQAWCSEQFTDCHPDGYRPLESDEVPGQAARFAVPIGDSLRLIPPAELSYSEIPWDLMAVYATPAGLQEERIRYWSDARVITLDSTADRALIGVTIYAYGAIVNPEGTDVGLLKRGQFAIDTLPDDFTIPEPDVMLPPVERTQR